MVTETATTAVFKIPFSVELALALSPLINCCQCGHCEKQEKVFIAQEDIEKVAKHINSTPEVVKGMMHIEGEHMITPCPFHKNGCSIYEARPITCRIFPMFQYEGRLAVSLECQAGIDMHNLLSMEKL